MSQHRVPMLTCKRKFYGTDEKIERDGRKEAVGRKISGLAFTLKSILSACRKCWITLSGGWKNIFSRNKNVR